MEADTDSGCEDDVQLRYQSDGLVKITEELQQRQRVVAHTDKGGPELENISVSPSSPLLLLPH